MLGLQPGPLLRTDFVAHARTARNCKLWWLSCCPRRPEQEIRTSLYVCMFASQNMVHPKWEQHKQMAGHTDQSVFIEIPVSETGSRARGVGQCTAASPREAKYHWIYKGFSSRDQYRKLPADCPTQFAEWIPRAGVPGRPKATSRTPRSSPRVILTN